jgi:hypothetical protein
VRPLKQEDGGDWFWLILIAAYFLLLCNLASCARPLKEVEHESATKAAIEVKAVEAAKEETATATRQESKEATETVYLRPDGKPWKVERRNAGVSLSVDTNNLKLLNSTLQLKGEVEEKAKGREVQRPGPPMWMGILGTVLTWALIAGAAGYGLFRVARRYLTGWLG